MTVVVLAAGAAVAAPAGAQAGGWLEHQSLDGGGNNRAHPDWGRAGTQYRRTAPTWYADGRGAPVAGPNSRYVSNRIFNDSVQREGPRPEIVGVDIFSETQVSQWGWVWGQFVDHNLALRQGVLPSHPNGGYAEIPTDRTDPLEMIPVEGIPFTRSAPAEGTGVTGPRQQVNTASSYLDGDAVYGATAPRLEWLREGPVDGDLSNNGARLLLPEQYLPVRGTRGDPDSSPEMELGGSLAHDPTDAVIAGDARANQNILLTATQTLFAREHNRIVGLLPASLPEETKFQIARRVVIAELQYITYQEFLPSLGIQLPAYRGYSPRVDATISNEFATTGYRAHSAVHGILTLETQTSRYTPAQLEAFRSRAIHATLSPDGQRVSLLVTLPNAQSNPTLVPLLQLGPLLQGIGLLPQYKNDESVDFIIRSFFCPEGGCVVDLGAIDLERNRDHGIASYNDLRRAYGLPPRTSFTQITGESTDAFPADPVLTPGAELDDWDSLDYLEIRNLFGTDLAPMNVTGDATAVSFTRRTTLAARLKGVYGSVDRVDALVGMMSEPHLPGSQFGELQQAIWARQFQALRDGDRFFYGNQRPALEHIRRAYGIDFRHTLGDLIAANTDIPRAELPGNVFYVAGNTPPTSCRVTYTVDSQAGETAGTFQATIRVKNTGHRPLDSWTLRYRYEDGQRITQAHEGVVKQNGAEVPIANTAANRVIGPGQTRTVRVEGTWQGANRRPAGFNLSSTPCAAAGDV